MALTHGYMGLSVVCDYGISRSYSLTISGKNIILCILKGEVSFKIHTIIFSSKKIRVPTLAKFFRSVTRNTHIFYLA